MNIHGLCCCVDYAEYLFTTGQAWMRGLTSLTVVSTARDLKTRNTLRLLQQTPAAKDCRLTLYNTEVFTERGAAFNKGAAMEEARRMMPWEDWILFFDVDIYPQEYWYQVGEALPEHEAPQCGYLYGAPRFQMEHYQAMPNLGLQSVGCPRIPDDRMGYGYFQLFHSLSPKLYDFEMSGGLTPMPLKRTLRTPLLETHWTHAGNYDSNFLLSFGSLVKELPIQLWHLGKPHENWYGKGREQAFKQMMDTRNGLGIHPSERLLEDCALEDIGLDPKV